MLDEVDFLLEQEKNKIQEDIMNKVEEEKKEAPKIIKETKADLINKFIELQQQNGEVLFDEKKLKRMTKQEILKLIANMANQVMENKEHTAEIEKHETEINPENLHLVAEGLFNMNLALVSILETGSIHFKEKTSGIAILENWSESVTKKKENFLFIFSLIYKDYKVQLDKYLNPMVQYSILMSQTAGECIYKNIQKKKEALKEN